MHNDRKCDVRADYSNLNELGKLLVHILEYNVNFGVVLCSGIAGAF